MTEFYAWAITGVVTEYETWVSTEGEHNAPSPTNRAPNPQRASQIPQWHKFILHNNDGRTAEVHFSSTEATFRDGHQVTAVWAAREGSSHGLCVYVENHTTDTTERLLENMALIQPKASFYKIAGYGLLATLPAVLALMMWLLIPGNIEGTSENTRLIGVILAIAVMFGLATLISKLIWNYWHREDEDKIWRVVRNAIRGRWTAPSHG